MDRLESVPRRTRSVAASMWLMLWPTVPALLLMAVTAIRPVAGDALFGTVVLVWYGVFALYTLGLGYALAAWFPRHPWALGFGWWLASCYPGAFAFFSLLPGLSHVHVQFLAAYPAGEQSLPNFILEPYLVAGWALVLLGVAAACRRRRPEPKGEKRHDRQRQWE